MYKFALGLLVASGSHGHQVLAVERPHVADDRFYGHQLNFHFHNQEVNGMAIEYAFPEFTPHSFWTMNRLAIALGSRSYTRTDEEGKREYLNSWEGALGLRQYWFTLGPLLLQQQLVLGRSFMEDKVGFGDVEESREYAFNYLDIRESVALIDSGSPLYTSFGVGLRSNSLNDKPFTVGGVLIPETVVYPFMDIGLRF